MPINNTPGTLEEWNAFISEYESNLVIQKTALDAKLNDGTLSDADKKKALEDYSRQESYLQWLKTKRDEYEATGEIPSDMSFNITANGDLYRYNGQIHVATLPSLTSYTGDTQDTLYTIDIGTTLTTKSNDICSSPDCIINLTWGGQHTFAEYTHESLKLVATYAPNARTIILGVTVNYSEDPWDKTAYMAASGSGTWVNASGYTPSDPATEYGWNKSGIVKFGIGYDYRIANTLNDIPTWSNSFYGMFSGPNIWQSFSPANELFARRYCSVSYSGDLSDTTPWDFYNDSILPYVDPDDAVFPGGYSPIPQKPDPDMPEFPEEVENGGDDIELPEPSDVGAGSTGFITFYAMTNAQVQTLGQLLYTTFTDPDYYKNFLPFTMGSAGSVNISDIISLFISFRQYPFPLLNLSSYTGVGQTFYIGSGAVGLPFGTTLHSINCMDYVDCGTCSVPFWFGDFRDYQTQVTLYLPYCGTVELNPADVMGGTLQCTYAVDFCTGACTAYVTVTSWDGKKYPVAQLPGQIGADVPLSGTNAGQISARIGGDVLNFAGTVLSGAKNVVSGGIGTIVGGISGNLGSTAKQGYGALFSEWDTLINVGKQIAGIGQRGAVAAPALSSGRGFAAFKNASTAYIQVRSPIYSMPDNYASAVGYPSTDAVQIDNCTGFCQFVNVDVTGITSDARDAAAIKRLLEQGIYVNAAPTA